MLFILLLVIDRVRITQRKTVTLAHAIARHLAGVKWNQDKLLLDVRGSDPKRVLEKDWPERHGFLVTAAHDLVSPIVGADGYILFFTS